MHRRMRQFRVAAFGLCAISIGVGLQSVSIRAGERSNGADVNVVSLPTGDDEIAAANRMARRTLPRFFELASAGVEGAYLLKMPINQGGQTEHIWMEVEGFGDGMFRGRLANDPQAPGKYRRGDLVMLRDSDVEDWMVQTGKHRYGAYTVRVLLKQLPPKEAEALRRQIRD